MSAISSFPTRQAPRGDPGPPGPDGPPGGAPVGTLAALTPPNRMIVRLSLGLTEFDGSEANSEALSSGGMCVTGGSAGAPGITYYTTGPAPVGVTGWPQDVLLYPLPGGTMVPKGDPALSGGLYSRSVGVYDGAVLSVAFGDPEFFL